MNNPIHYYVYRIYDWQFRQSGNINKSKFNAKFGLFLPLFFNCLSLFFVIVQLFELGPSLIQSKGIYVIIAIVVVLLALLSKYFGEYGLFEGLDLKYHNEQKDARIRKGMIAVLYPLLSFVILIVAIVACAKK